MPAVNLRVCWPPRCRIPYRWIRSLPRQAPDRAMQAQIATRQTSGGTQPPTRTELRMPPPDSHPEELVQPWPLRRLPTRYARTSATGSPDLRTPVLHDHSVVVPLCVKTQLIVGATGDVAAQTVSTSSRPARRAASSTHCTPVPGGLSNLAFGSVNARLSPHRGFLAAALRPSFPLDWHRGAGPRQGL